MKRYAFAILMACAITLGCSATDDSAGSSTGDDGATTAVTAMSTSTSDTDESTGTASSGSTGAEYTAQDDILGLEEQHSALVGMMHCCFKWKDKCACYSTLDGDCRPCYKINN